MNEITFYTWGRCTLRGREWKYLKNRVVNKVYRVHSPGGFYETDGRRIPLEPGNLYLFPALCDVRFLKDPDAAFDHSYLDFSLSPPLGIAEPVVLRLEPGSLLTRTADLFDAYVTGHPRTPERDAFVGRLLENLLDLISEEVPLRRLADERILRAIRLIHRTPGEIPDVSVLAGEACMEKTHFIRAFRRATGTTPYRYANAFRAQLAVSWIRAGVTATEAANRLGYAELPAFSAMMRKMTGRSPAEWKNI